MERAPSQALDHWEVFTRLQTGRCAWRSRLLASALAFCVFCILPRASLGQSSPATLPDLKLSTAGLVRSLAVQGDGKIVIAGFFQVDGLPRPYLARLNPNGSVDRHWIPSIVQSEADIKAVAVSGPYVYLAGGAIAPGRQGLARFSILNGAWDSTWNPGITMGTVECIAVDGTNAYFGGHFIAASGSISNIARASLTGAGTVDTSWTALANDTVQRLVLEGTDLFVAGKFLLPRPGLAKLSTSTGALDPDWSPPVSLLSTGDYTGLAILGTNLYVANDFTNGTPSGLLKLSTGGTGAADTNWNPVLPAGNSNLALAVVSDSVFVGGVSGGRTFLVKANAEGSGALDDIWIQNARLDDAANEGAAIFALAGTNSGLFVGGSFVQSGGSVSLGVSKLDPVTGLRREEFFAQVQLPGIVRAIERQVDGKLIVGGSFQLAGGLPRRNLVRVNTDGTVDSSWAPDPNGEVFALAASGTRLFIGGQFTEIGGTNRTNLAKVALVASDAADPFWEAGITNPTATVLTLAVAGDSLLVGGGRFGLIDGHGRNGLAKLDLATGDVIPNWNPNPLWPASSIGGINTIVASGNEVFVGGNFFNIGGFHRRSLAKLALPTGAVITNWNPTLLPDNDQTRVTAMAQDETNLFIGGSFTEVSGQGRTNLAKLSGEGTGALDSLWNPAGNSAPLIETLHVQKTGLLVGGSFPNLAGLSHRNLVRVGVETGAGDVDFGPDPNGCVFTVLAGGDGDVFVGGQFGTIGGASRNGFAFMTRAAAPMFVQQNETNFFLTRNPLDGSEVTHFQIQGVTGGDLYRNNSGTPVTNGDFLTVAEGEAGFTFMPGVGGTVTAVSALNTTPAGLGTAQSTLTMVANPSAVFQFEPASYSVREGDGNLIVTVRKYGTAAGSVEYSTPGLSAVPNVDFLKKAGTLNFSAKDEFKNIVVQIADDLFRQGDRHFLINLTNATIAGSYSAEVTIVDNDILGESESFLTTIRPGDPPASDGVLTVTLDPTNALWRLQGELDWHASGAMVVGLVTGNYGIEFQPFSGYYVLDDVTVPISAGRPNVFAFSYAATGANLTTGNLTVTIEPSEAVSAGAQWQYEGEVNWHNSGAVIAQLPSGYYAVKFKPVTDWITPSPRIVTVGADATYGITATYVYATTTAGQSPGVVPFDTVTKEGPYVYNGQLQTSVGFSSGFVVKSRVVLTVAHALFDDYYLTYVSDAHWYFQRYRDKLEPVPQTPRGWYIFDGYASQRQKDNSPGISTPQSQQLDAAALYFLEDAGRGGYGGYLSSDAANNEFLLSGNSKFLAGYPIEGVSETDQGKLHATEPMFLSFTHLYDSVFATTDIQSAPGNSGGPLYVRNSVDGTNKFLPAGIYLGGSGETLVRAIDSSVVDLINRADQSSHGGGNSAGGGPVLVSGGSLLSGSDLPTGNLTVNLHSAVGTGGWRSDLVTGTNDSVYITNATFSTNIGVDNYSLEFRPVAGYIAPGNVTVGVTNNQSTVVDAFYLVNQPLLLLDPKDGLAITGTEASAYRIEYTSQLSSRCSWSVLTNVTLQAGTNWILNELPTTESNRFYRAVWLPD